MSEKSSAPDFIQQSTENVALFIQWIATLIRRRNWFMLLVLCGVALAFLGSIFRQQINNQFLSENAQGPFWASFWTAVVLLFVGALVVAVVTMPRSAPVDEVEEEEGKVIKGLRPFGREDVAVFARLQREVSLRECCEAICSDAYRFGILMGESGCGKTSFLQAGIWPKLTEPDSPCRAIYVRFSDQEPLATVRKALAEQLEMPAEWLRKSSFSTLVKQAIEAAGQPIVLLFDQFEQFFVHYPRTDDRAAFIQSLKSWYRKDSLDGRVLISIRADLLHELYELHTALQYTLGPQDLFKLDRFTPEEATKVLAVVAENENLDFDAKFVTEIAEKELAHPESLTVSPVDIQVLSWMIVRQKGDELRAFNRTAFQKFGGVEGLLTRFLEYTLEPRILPNQRQAAVKTLQALTDLDRQVRAGVLTLPEIQTKLRGTAQPQEIQEAVSWLSRSDVRLITPQDKEGEQGYELAHERLIPALMRLAGKELTQADKANQLLERRVNEWLGNQSSSRYLLGWRELWLIQRQQPYLIWGAKRKQKERLIRLSRNRTYRWLTVVGVVLLTVTAFNSWLQFTPAGQMQQVRWALRGRAERISLSDYDTSEVANAFIKDKQYAKGLKLIEEHIESRSAKASALEEVAETGLRLSNLNLLSNASDITFKIDDPNSKANALSAIASAYGRIKDVPKAQTVLEKALSATDDIDDPYSKVNVLGAIAGAYGRIKDVPKAQTVLEKALSTTDDIDDPNSKANVLSAIASAYEQIEDVTKAQTVLEKALSTTDDIDDPDSKTYALSVIASAYEQIEDVPKAQTVLEKALSATDDIDDYRGAKTYALSTVARVSGQIEDVTKAQTVLEKVLSETNAINDPNSKANVLSAIASAYGQIEDATKAQTVLEKALSATDDIDNPYAKAEALSAIARVSGQIEDATKAQTVLEKALSKTNDIDDFRGSKAEALSAIANAYGQIEDVTKAQTVLEKALSETNDIDEPDSKNYVLSTIARVSGQLENVDIAQDLLIHIRQMAEKGGNSSTLSQIASYQSLYGNWQAALRTLRTSLERDKVTAYAEILTHHAESRYPSLIDGPVVLAVESVEKATEQYEFSVTIQSPDEGCDRHANWWEILSEEGELLGRKIIDSPHEFERPFKTTATFTIPNTEQTIIVRAHFSDFINENYRGDPYNNGNEVGEYTTQAMKGTLSKANSFESIRLPAQFASKVERIGEQPKQCEENKTATN